MRWWRWQRGASRSPGAELGTHRPWSSPVGTAPCCSLSAVSAGVEQVLDIRGYRWALEGGVCMGQESCSVPAAAQPPRGTTSRAHPTPVLSFVAFSRSVGCRHSALTDQLPMGPISQTPAGANRSPVWLLTDGSSSRTPAPCCECPFPTAAGAGPSRALRVGRE